MKISDNIYSVGVKDWDLRNFHGYSTHKGSSYNSYLILDEKKVLIDCVKEEFSREFINNINKITNLAELDYIVVNHVEKDHSGALPEILKIAKNAIIIASKNGGIALKEHFNISNKIVVVENDDILKIGKFSLSFIMAQMVHWPDSMATYLNEEKMLFSNDAFGQHIASSCIFADEVPFVTYEAKKYYANIVYPYGRAINKFIENLKKYSFEMILPSHGLIWRNDGVNEVVTLYKDILENKCKKEVVVVFDTMWGETKKIAHLIAEEFSNNGFDYKIYNLAKTDISDIIVEIVDSQYLCIGSSTLNNNFLPNVSAFITYLKGLLPNKQKAGFAFGSYGWGGQSIDQINEFMLNKFYNVANSIKVKYSVDNNINILIKNSVKTLLNGDR